ncbi:beta-soluble NSF attachment protein isoform 4-T8 [Alca torda]
MKATSREPKVQLLPPALKLKSFHGNSARTVNKSRIRAEGGWGGWEKDLQVGINSLFSSFRHTLYVQLTWERGRFTIAAKHHITIAEIYEAELVDIEKAIAHYEQAADYYKGEESNSSANKCLLKVAAYAAQLEQYQKAIEIYEQVGTNTMDNPLLKYSAKEYFFKAALCHFIVDELNAKLALEKYEEMFPAFTDSRECKLLKKLLEAHEEQNCEAYTEAVSSHKFAKACSWMARCSFLLPFWGVRAVKCWVTGCPSSRCCSRVCWGKTLGAAQLNHPATPQPAGERDVSRVASSPCSTKSQT